MAQDIRNIETIAPEQITKKRKSPLGAILYMVIGAAIACARYYMPSLNDNADMASGVMLVGWTVALIGIVKIIIMFTGHNSFNYIYTPTGEKLKPFELLFELSQKDKVCQLVKEGQFDKLAKIPRSTISSVKVILFAIPNKEVKWAQVFEFVPHTHVPITDVIGYTSSPMPADLAA